MRLALGAWLCVCFGLVSVALPARASEGYSPTIARIYGLDCPPACTLCHTLPEGGFLTANAPFGIAARRARLPCCDPGSVEGALAEIEANGTDSDQDGTPDIAELRAGADPNGPSESLECAPPVERDSGCSVAGSGTKSFSVFGPSAALLASFLLVRRKRAGVRLQRTARLAKK